jgi:hypothetical protein
MLVGVVLPVVAVLLQRCYSDQGLHSRPVFQKLLAFWSGRNKIPAELIAIEILGLLIPSPLRREPPLFVQRNTIKFAEEVTTPCLTSGPRPHPILLRLQAGAASAAQSSTGSIPGVPDILISPSRAKHKSMSSLIISRSLYRTGHACAWPAYAGSTAHQESARSPHQGSQ